MKKQFILLITGCLVSWAVFSQSAGAILNAHAFYSVTLPGNIPVDDNGNKMDPGPSVERFIYIEVKGSLKPQITKVYYDGVPFTAVVVPGDPNTIDVGKTYKNGKPFLLKPKRLNRYWKITLEKASEKAAPVTPAKRIIIYGKAGGRTFKYFTYKETQLSVPERY